MIRRRSIRGLEKPDSAPAYMDCRFRQSFWEHMNWRDGCQCRQVLLCVPARYPSPLCPVKQAGYDSQSPRQSGYIAAATTEDGAAQLYVRQL